MQALPARRLDEAHQTQAVEPHAHLACRLDHRAPWHILARIEIEDQAVGLLETAERRTPRMDFDHARLHEGDQAGEVIEHQHRFFALADVDTAYHVADAGPGMLGKKAFLGDPRGTT